jgi:1,2-phenylacetyl-CoA epoxidase catalytic subunit
MKKRVVFRIQLTAEAKKRLLDISDQLGITQIAITSRIVEWFANQPDLIQAAILGLYPDLIKQDVATLILNRLAEGKEGKDKAEKTDKAEKLAK